MGRSGLVLVLLVYQVAADLPYNDCGEPPPSANTYRTFPDNNTVEYRCIDTYILSSGDLVRHCVDGKYNGTTPVCIVNCGPPLNSSYASIDMTGTKEGDNVTYSCPDGSIVSSTVTQCSGTTGYWEAGDRCFGSLDVASFTAEQTSTATLLDISKTTNLSLSSSSTFDAANAVDPTKLGESLLTGGCSSTKLEQRPHMSIKLGGYYSIYQIAVTLPDDDFAFSIPNLKVMYTDTSSFNKYSRSCLRGEAVPAGSRVMANCSVTRYPPSGKYIHLEADFGDKTGMLQICRIEVYARPVTSVDCGQPPERLFAVMSSPPSNTHYQNNKYQVTYECIDGYTVKIGRVKGYCSTYGTWTASLVCTADDNLSHNKPVSLAGSDATDVSPLTDGNTTSCSIIPGVTEATFVIDLGKDTEMSDVSITLNDVVALKTPYVNVTVWRDGYPASSCYAGRLYLYSWYTKNIACSYFPVGRYISVHIYYSNVASLEVCEIMVHGRPYTEALECQRRVWSSQDYKGNMNMTVAGIPCQRWDSKSPHAHSHTNVSNFPDDNLQDAANYCRNPDRKNGQWCFTNDPDVEWQYCPIRVCDDMCLLGDKGSTYTGSMQKTSSGASCVTWSEADTPFKKTSYFSWSWWSRKLYCRNPVHSQSRPWCYTSTDGSQYGLCDIPITCPTSSEVTRGRWVLGSDQTVDELLPSTECLVWNNLFTSDGVFSGSHYSASTPVSFVGNFAAEDVCVAEKVFNTSILCYNVTESGTVWKAGVLECVYCGSPPRVDNSNVSISSSLLNGNATYTCVTGYRHASGSSKVTCLKSGLWEVPDVVCKVNCGDPPSNNRTEFSSTNGFVNETVEYTCKPGYAHVSGSTVITCLDTGTWEEPTITCEVDCGDPSPVDHADIYVNSTWLGQTVNYSCHDAYAHTSGSDQVTCLDTGNWDVADMICEVDCGDPSPVDHADIYVNSTWLGQTVNYSCHDGYARTSGSDQITCLDTGNWDVADMTCEVDCGSPPPVLNARVIVSGTWQNNVAQYACHDGFTSSGSASVTCLQNGSWETHSYTCEGVLPLATSSPRQNELPVDRYGRTRSERCICRCINKEPRKQEDILAEISKNLTLNTKSLMSNVMTKESLPDERNSSHGMAYVAMSIIGTLFGVVFFSDIYYFISGIKRQLSVRRRRIL